MTASNRFRLFCLAICIAASTLLAQTRLPVWGSIPTPNNGDLQNEIRGIAPVTSTDVWAVGDYNSGVIPTVSGRRTLIEHWDGRAWGIVPSTRLDLPGFDAVILEDALALASSSIWAVGHADDFTTLNSATVIAHYDGANWSLVPSPNPSGNSLPDALYAIARASNRLYAVGETGFPGGPLIAAWNGSAWRTVANQCVGGLRGVSAASPAAVFAAGLYSVCRFDGTSWNDLPLPPLPSGEFYQLQNVAALSSVDVWVVGAIAIPSGGGEGGGYSYDSVAMHWNGSAWTTYNPLPHKQFAGIFLNGILARSSTNIWAVGTQNVGGIIVHWNGQQWDQEPSPAYLYGAFEDVKVSSTGEMWAGGSTLTNQQQVTLVARAPSNKSVVEGTTGASAALVTWIGPTTGNVGCDLSGHYVVPDLPAGTYNFIASLDGCAPGAAVLNLSPGIIANQDLRVSCGP